MIEIERKFLVISEDFKKESHSKTRIVQGFLNTNPERTVRVRLRGDTGFLTVKGKSTDDGLKRFEWEKEISKSDAEALLLLCEKGVIDKVRYDINVGEHTFEVDVFSEDNKGLILAEVELSHQDEVFEKPEWLGKEVTGDKRYYNSTLSKNPFNTWI
ncbi:CYTH domain-containing protein [Psychroserpens algicola]|uniref:CYTH domain-containing protein n=1 Tax=Psychroserpens algicola TaxID=1719034 RepID=A0ABT0H7J7_9FLAO|nr:CYTH domain-containing protein [Psychroserpens algicola]MCK8480321.1 CYTH domain-containing protein [Psychroserpens algicola]